MSVVDQLAPEAIDHLDFEVICEVSERHPGGEWVKCHRPAVSYGRCRRCGHLDPTCAHHVAVARNPLVSITCPRCKATGPAPDLYEFIPLEGNA